MEVFLVYLWLKLDSLHVAFHLLIFASLIGGAGCTAATIDEYGEVKARWFKRMRRFVFSALCFLGLAVFMPSSKEAAILVGTSYAVDLAKSPEGVKVVSLIRQKANQYLDEELKKGTK